ncbi:hypothetical protein L7F22_063226 [Adiantum nelumboides]|nr:hypothetical protein [Adiantum nelumboides]
MFLAEGDIMQQIIEGSGLQGSQAQGSVSSQSTRSVGDPPQNSRATSSRSKKRERSDLVCESVKFQRTEKSRRCSEEGVNNLKPEASSLVGKDGGISSVASVDRLVCIMQYEWNDSADRQFELIVSRTMLVKVVAATSDVDCLSKFLKLGGLSILDKWLQEAHRGKHFVNKEVSEDIGKAVEDLLLALLGALERLPVDLLALKICPVGKSVNLLRNYKHIDIQRKAKKLVDVWRKKVESEMKQSVEGRHLMDPALTMHQQEAGTMTSKAHLSNCPDPMSHDTVGRGKFSSVALLCSSQEGQLKTSPLVSMASVMDNCGDMARKVADSAQVSSRSFKAEVLDSPPFYASSSENGRMKSTFDVPSAQLPSDEVKGSKSSGASTNRRTFNASSSKTCSVTASASAPVTISNYSTANSFKESYGLATQSGPSCSSSPKKPETSLVYDGLSRSSVNSLSSCATDCNRFSALSCMYPESGKAGIQLLASIAASEGSMVDMKGSDSLSNRSVSLQRVSTYPIESRAPVFSSMGDFIHPSKAASAVQGGPEHYDQISSTVSSPSETSAHVDIRVCESHRTLAVAVMTSPHDTISDTKIPSTYVRKDGIRDGFTVKSLQMNEQNMLAVSKKLRPVSLEHKLEDETVGEINAISRANSKDKEIGTSGTGQEGTVAKEEQGVADSFDDALRREISSRNFAVCGDATFPARSVDNKLQDTSSKSLCKSGGFAPVKRCVNDRPAFDLNEMLISEEAANQTVAASSSGLTMPTHFRSVPASGFKPTSCVTPMTPIAVVAAAKGLFILPSFSNVANGEIGWKGSAPTSAFRPMQPRNCPHKPNPIVAECGANAKVVMDFDLNVAADPRFADHDMGLNPSTGAAPVPAKQDTTIPIGGCSGLSQKANGMREAMWDLNQVDEGVAESYGRPDFDLNSGPMVQDNDDVALASKHHGICRPFSSAATNSGAAIRMHSFTPSSVTPIMIPAFANSDFSYPGGGASPWSNSGTHEGMFHYNIFLQNQPGMACPPLPSMPTGSYGGIPFGFSPEVDTLCGPHTAPLGPPSTSNGEQSLLPSQSNKPPPYIMGVLSDAVQHQGKGSFWSRSNLDLNAGPDGIDAKNLEERRRMLFLNEQMRARNQNMDTAAVLKQREQEGYLSMPGSMQGAILKQSVWR